MEYYLLNMHILDYKDDFFTISISDNNSICKILFSPETRDLQYPEKNELTQFIKLKEFQLRKILHNKRHIIVPRCRSRGTDQINISIPSGLNFNFDRKCCRRMIAFG